MTDRRTAEMAEESNTIKDPDDWVTGDEPMTGAQRSYLKTLCEEAHVEFDERLTKAEASRRIDELQHRTGRGLERKRPTEDDAAGHGEGSTNPGSAGSGAGDEATLSIGSD